MSNLRDTKCGRCGCWRKAEDFISNERIVKCCVKCRDYQKTYADKNRDKKKQYYQENKEVLKKQNKQNYEENKEEILEKQKQTYQENKIENPLHFKFNIMIKNSKTADKKYNRIYDKEEYINEDFLNELWINQNGKCYYECCNVELSLEFNKDYKNPTQISIQRLNNELSHLKDNCVLSCYKCNVSHKEDADFYKKMIEQITLQ